MPRRTAAPPAHLLAVLALASAGAAQEARPTGCRTCEGRGAKDCSRHGKDLLPLEQGVRFCSEAAACRACEGALRVDCSRCANAEVEAEMLARRRLVAEWRQQRRERVDEVTHGQPLMHLATEHADLAYGIRPLTVGRDKLDTHEGMHLYGRRLEDFRSLFLTTLELQEADFSARLQVYMCRDQQGVMDLGPRVTGIGGGGPAVGSKLMGVDAVYCMWHDLRSMPDDEALHRNIVHNVTHLLLSNMATAQRMGNPRNGWLDEGLAHWFEDKVTGRCTNFCFEEVLMQPMAGFKGGRWRAPVRRMVDAGELTGFPELATRNTDQLTFPEHAQSFACVDFLLAVHGGAKFRDMVRALKRGEELRDVLREVYGLSPLTFDEAFTTWVKDNYSPQDSR